MDALALEARPVAYNPVIEKMLGMVNPDSVEALERKLCSFHTRHAKSATSKDELMPWFKEIFRAYGCDTVLDLPLSGYSPAIAGVRLGTVEPTMKKFTLLGGHNDNIIGGASADTRHEGANDNATGTAAVLEACRVHRHFTFDYTIVYCAFNAEEYGYHGSNAIMKYLKDNGCKAIGGCFSYDMFGMSKNDMSFSAYTGVAGCDEFVDQMKKIKELYRLTQPATINTTNNASPPTDSRSIWKYGYQGITHNFATAGAGGIHTSGDVIKSTYDKIFQAECAKLGIATTAEQALPKETGIAARPGAPRRPAFTCTRSGGRVVVTFDKTAPRASGTLFVYGLQGKRFAAIPVDRSAANIAWRPGAAASGHSVLLFRYSAPSGTSIVKFVMR